MRIQGYMLDDPAGKDITIRDSAGTEITSADPVAILDFLLRPYPDMKVVWDVDAFIAPILRLLGLAICRRIVEQHEVTITAHSVPGKGSTFEILLPMQALEDTEEFIHKLHIEANTIVADKDYHFGFIFLFTSDLDLRTLSRTSELQGVRDQVDQHNTQHDSITADHGQR